MDENKDWEYIDPIDDDEEAIDRRDFLDDKELLSKKSGEKTVEERIKTSRSFKIKNNKWNQVDYTEDFSNEKIVIDPQYNQTNYSYEDVEFEKDFHNIIKNSKYKELLLGEDKYTITYQVVNEIIIYCYGKMKRDYTLSRIFVLVCEYCGVGLPAMYKKSSEYVKLQILKELSEVSKLPKELIENYIKLF